MKLLKIRKIKILPLLEIIIVLHFFLRCFGNCAEYTLDMYAFSQCTDVDLTYFDDGVGIESQEYVGEFNLMDCALPLRSGAYSITVEYDSVSHSDEMNDDSYIGKLVILHTDNPAALRTLEIPLDSSLNVAQSRFWLRQGIGERRILFRIIYGGTGKLAVKRIQIEEKKEYRVLLCIATVCVMVVCNIFYIVYIKVDSSSDKWKIRVVVAGITGITILASMTYLTDFLYNAHDSRFHLSRIVSLAEALKEFQIPHRIQFEMLNGYGYAAPLYYGELFLILPAVLYNLYLPLQTCYQIFVVVVNLLTCIISYWCFKRMSDDWKKGLLGAFVYTLAAYRLMDVMVRGAVGEYVALIFFPLMLYGFWNIYGKRPEEKILTKDCISIILAATGIINSHVLSCEMILLFVILFALINYKETSRKNIFIALLKSMVIILLLNLWFIFPFVQSMKMNIVVNNRDIISEMEPKKIYLDQLLGIFHSSGGGNQWWSTQNEMPLSIGISIIIGIVLFIYACMKKDEWHLQYSGKMKAATQCFVLGVTALFFSSLFRWDDLIYISRKIAQIASMVQFPWRYLGIATALLTGMMILILQVVEKKISSHFYQHIVFIIIFATIITEGHFIMEYVNTQDEERIYSESDVGTVGIMKAEYLLYGTDLTEYKIEKSVHTSGTDVVCSGFRYDRNGKYNLSISNHSDVKGYIDVPIQAYDNYHAYTGEGEELCLETGENNKIRVLVPGFYNGTICIKYEVPVLWRLCELISLITGCVLIAMYVRNIEK